MERNHREGKVTNMVFGGYRVPKSVSYLFEVVIVTAETLSNFSDCFVEILKIFLYVWVPVTFVV